MALSQSSKILVSDINTALSNKQDKLSYTPVKSVNGTTADSSGNVAISVSAPVTSVNGMTGAVTISSVSTATTATKATTCPNVYVTSSNSISDKTIPSGGTWKYMASNNSGTTTIVHIGTVSGGAKVTCSNIIAIRTA